MPRFGPVAVAQRVLVVRAAGGKAMGEVGAAQRLARGLLAGRRVDARRDSGCAAALLRSMIFSVTAETIAWTGMDLNLLSRGTSRVSEACLTRRTARTGMSAIGAFRQGLVQHVALFLPFDVKDRGPWHSSSAGRVKVRRGSPAAGADISMSSLLGLADRWLRPECRRPGRTRQCGHRLPMPRTTTSKGGSAAAASGLSNERNERRAAAALFCREAVAHQPRIGALAGFRHLAFVDQGHVTLSQGISNRDKVSKKSFGVVPPETASVGLALASDGAAQVIGHIGRPGLTARLPRGFQTTVRLAIMQRRLRARCGRRARSARRRRWPPGAGGIGLGQRRAMPSSRPGSDRSMSMRPPPRRGA